MASESALTASKDARPSYPMWRRVAEVVAAALAYLILARVSLSFASLNASVTPVWPPTGLAIALVLMRGNSMLAAVLAGAFLANFMTTPSIPTSIAIAVGNSLEALVASVLLRRWADGERVFYSPVGIGKFALIVIGAAAPVSATIGAAALAVTGFAMWTGLLPVWMTWWLGDLAGAILITPALVLWTRTWSGAETREVAHQTVLTLVGAALVGLLAFSPVSPAPTGVRGALAFLAIMPLLWAALRLGLRDTATTALVISSFAVWGVIAETSPFNQTTLNDSLLLLVAFIVAATLPSLALAADRREAQSALRQTRQELAQSQKLEALGQLTGGVAHDFNNLLMAIASGVRSLNRHEEERTKTLAAINETLERAAVLTRQLLAFSRREPPESQVVEISEVMRGVETMLGQSLGGNIKTVFRVAPGTWRVKVDRNQLELAILNLALNARDAMPDGGELVIQADNAVDASVQQVVISVTDTGAGMNADVAERAFEPFFSTKPTGVGTGLGLAQVYNFAKQSGGHAHIESAPNEGAAVSIILPRA
jgi:signal transduction histidine kinase